MENTFKKEKKQHDHKLTKLLKVSIFATVMIAPFIAVGSSCAYMALNKNAVMPTQQETTTNKIAYQTNEVNSINDLINGNIYRLDGNDSYITYIEKAFDYYDILITYQATEDAPFYTENGSFYDFTETQLIEDFIGGLYIVWNDVNLTNNSNIIYTDFAKSDTTFYYYETTTNTIQNETNVFYYAVDQLQEQPLFNWTQNTAIYSGLQTLTSGMGNNNPTIAILLTYWTITTCIYVIFDIVIELFTWLTHLIGER